MNRKVVMKTYRIVYFIVVLIFFLAGCSSPTSSSLPSATEPGITMTVAPTPELPATQTSAADSQAVSLPDVVEYNLGDTTITQSMFTEDSRFRNMPVRLNGLIAVPTTGEGPFPVVVILHGTHPGCPEIDHVDRWPCDPADERPNYRGFAYLAEHLAAQGYVALSMNINAENTFGFGEPVAGERLKQIVDLQLRALATAAAGGENKFGVDLNGKADVRRLALIGHSRGGENALMVAQDAQLGASGTDGYGPVAGVLQIAPSPGFVDPLKGSPVPVGIILPMCDGDVIQQEGQKLYEGARLAPGQQDWVTSAFLERANHNYFNSTLGDDPFGRRGRLDCEPRLEAQTQQEFLNAYAVDFLAALFGSDSTAKAAKARLAIDPSAPSPSELYGLPARVAVLPSAGERTVIFTPATADEFKTNRLGGTVLAQDVTLFFCEAGYYTPFTRPGTEPCRRVNVIVPGDPALAVVSWEKPGAALRFEIPQGQGDLSQAAAISLRAAIDPISALNPAGKGQAFTVLLTDGTGKTAAVHTRSDEPALQFPIGEVETDQGIEGGLFSGRVPLTTIRLPVQDFKGIDLSDIREMALVFDQTPSGSLFMGDVEVVR
jgi:dienelactone hydrolase